MKRVCLSIFICIVFLIACGKNRKPEYKLLSVGAGEFNPARPDTEYIVDIYIPFDVSVKDAESLGVAIMKEQIAAHPTWKRAVLKAHNDSTNYAKRREELQILWYGAGEPQIIVNRWESGVKTDKRKK